MVPELNRIFQGNEEIQRLVLWEITGVRTPFVAEIGMHVESAT